MHGLWLDNENFFNALIEKEISELSLSGPDSLLTVWFPQYRTAGGQPHFIRLRASLRDPLLVADNKMLNHLQGRISTGGHARTNLLMPIPSQLFDCVSLYEPATLVDNIDLRVLTLHNAILLMRALCACGVVRLASVFLL